MHAQMVTATIATPTCGDHAPVDSQIHYTTESGACVIAFISTTRLGIRPRKGFLAQINGQTS